MRYQALYQISLFVVFSLLIFNNDTASAEKSVLKATGTIYQLETGKKLFTEKATYYRKNGRYLSEKRLFYSGGRRKGILESQIKFNRSAPGYYFKDYRDDRKEGVTEYKKGFNLYFQMNMAADIRNEWVPRNDGPPFVNIAGINAFIQKNEEKLRQGEELKFRFLVPHRRDYYTFRAYKASSYTEKGKVYLKLKVDLNNILLRMLSEPIIIVWAIETDRVVEYRGLHYMRDGTSANGSKVSIKYRYGS